MNILNLKRIGAITLVVLLLGLYITTFILAFMKSPTAQKLFQASAIATIALPVMLYAYMLIYKYLKNRNNPNQ
ncbi:hypothetical protein [[Clostridium] fimetarium]|uniref:Uncharacterized protein n=1 Tax=[Clostridium] fimetarium TaxID=99656 RepID=A0A1I0R1V8_9FIRM|nr:hypothetical protein [[Clostridium] fimetarium]SEW34273.1 hypothetical protein SAMN05421659_11135 [[Clostridium] fimetarium]